MDLKKIQRKLQKLLALSASPNEAEAALAMEKCSELMEKYGIRTIDVNIETHEVDLSTECVEGYTSEHRDWESKLAAAIANTFDAEAIIQHREDGWNIMFIASFSEQAIVTDLYKRLRRVVSKLSKAYSKKYNGDNDVLEKSYAFGMINTIYTRLGTINACNVDERGLVLVKKEAIESKIKDMFGDIQFEEPEAPDDRMAYLQGEVDGEGVNLSKSIKRTPNRDKVESTL